MGISSLIIAASAATWTLSPSNDAFDDTATNQLIARSEQGVAIFTCRNGRIDLSIASVATIGKTPVYRTGRVRADKSQPITVTFIVTSRFAASTKDGAANIPARAALGAKDIMGIEILDGSGLPVRMSFTMAAGVKERAAFLNACR